MGLEKAEAKGEIGVHPSPALVRRTGKTTNERKYTR